MKKILVVMLVCALSFSISACGSKKEASEEKSKTSEESTADKKKETKKEETKKEDTTKDSSADVADAVNMEDSSATPAKLNQWMKTTLYSTVDKLYHTVYIRMTKITTMSDDADYVNKAIETHNSFEEGYKTIDMNELKLPADVELCVLDYEVMIPAEFPPNEYGLTEPKISFTAKNIDGGGIPSADGTTSYIGLGSGDFLNITDSEQKYEPGNTYPMRGYFAMVKGFKDYNITSNSYPDGTESGKLVDCVWASH